MRRIVYLCDDGAESAKQLYDCDVIALPITIEFLLQTIWHRTKPGAFPPPTTIYASADPWHSWVLESRANYEELWNYAMDICDEHFHRFGSHHVKPYPHTSLTRLESLAALPPLPDIPQTPRPLTPLSEYKSIAGFWVAFTNREKPEWLK